jgi:hypothetical protein
MSANKWSICPRCLAAGRDRAEAEHRAVMALYGSIPVEEFDAKRSALPDFDPEAYQTFREDYEFYGAEEGQVQADYKGQCDACGLSVELHAERRFWGGP